MLYYRRKILLALLEAFGGQLEKIDLQKLLFLFCQKQQNIVKSYYFLPYKFGCFSYQSDYDLGALCIKGFIKEEGHNWLKTDSKSYTNDLTADDQITLKWLKSTYKDFETNALIKETYIKYPFYAINSTIYKERLSPEDIAKVEVAKPKNEQTSLYTIGYEGVSLEQYFEKLIRADVKVLCDVRKNPLSQKYGFSKTMLQKVCAAMNILYVHIPALGINSDKRQALHTQADYDALFKVYKAETLSESDAAIAQVLDLLNTHQRVALTCFEAHHCQCHRGTLATHITDLPTFSHSLNHL